MKTMTNQELEAKLAEAVDRLQPDLCSRAATASVGNAADLVPQSQPGRRPMSKFRTIAVAACLCLILMGGAGAYTWLYPAAQIGLDVNPSIELTTNTFDRVLSAAALNADAEVVLGSLQLRGVELDTAISAIIGSIVQNGFLEQSGGEVRISVTAGSEKRILRLEQQISEDVRKALPQEKANVAVTVKPSQQEGAATTQTEIKPQPELPPNGTVAGVDAVSEPTTQQPTQQNPQPQTPSTPSNGADTSNGKQAWIQRALVLDPSLDAATLQTYSVKQLRELVDDLEDQLEDADDDNDDGDDDDGDDDDDDNDSHGPGKNNANGNNRDHDDRDDNDDKD